MKPPKLVTVDRYMTRALNLNNMPHCPSGKSSMIVTFLWSKNFHNKTGSHTPVPKLTTQAFDRHQTLDTSNNIMLSTPQIHQHPGQQNRTNRPSKEKPGQPAGHEGESKTCSTPSRPDTTLLGMLMKASTTQKRDPKKDSFCERFVFPRAEQHPAMAALGRRGTRKIV